MRAFRIAALAGTALAVAIAVPSSADAAARSWHVRATPQIKNGEMNSVLTFSRSNAWAFGGSGEASSMKPLAYHWNGKSWRSVTVPGLHGWLTVSSAVSASDIWVVNSPGEAGDGTEAVLHWNGTKWSVSKKGFAGHPTSLAAISRSNVWLFGAPGADQGSGTWHYNGKTWTRRYPPFYPGAASAVSASNIWAVGRGKSGDSRTVGHYNGKTWSTTTLSKVLPADSADGLHGVSLRTVRATSAKSVWVAGYFDVNNRQVPLLVHWNGTAWHRISVPGTGTLDDITPDGHGGLWFSRMSWSGTSNTTAIIHRSAAASWTTATVTGMGGKSLLVVGGLARIPGTTTMWGAASLHTLYANPSGVILSY